ncbi:MAG TPA: VC0807 family protein [Caulobacteraceae bacterium]|nr:VC0807 family protein [Caulobacteraceae bacterium]
MAAMIISSENIARARDWLRANGGKAAVEVLVNFVLPFLIYRFAKHDLGDVRALIASSGPPVAWSIFELIRNRRVDALSMLVVAGIVLSLIAVAGGGSVRFLQLREKLVTALIGLVFLGSAAIRRPLIYQLARATIMRRSPSELGDFEALRDNIHFKRVMNVMTLTWGFGLVAEAGATAALVFAVPIQEYLLISPVMGYATMGALSLWTFWYGRRARRRGEARRVAEAAAAAGEIKAAEATPAPTAPRPPRARGG